MSDTTNGWPDKPGVPVNPGLPGAHWLKGYTEDAWMYDGDGGWWGPGYSHNLDAGTVAARYSYLGPCLTPDEATALQKRADQSALGYAREARRADLLKFLYKRDVAELQAALRDARDDLVAFIENAHPHREKYPHIMKDFENDMEIVRRIDAALEGGKKDE